jgi:outer membrane protein assembly factor BamB
VLLTKGYSQGAALLKVVREKGEWRIDEVWQKRSVLKTKFTNVAVKGESIFALSDGVLECVDWRTGERRWKSGRYGNGQILLVGDVLLVQAETGEVALALASSEGFIELGQFPALEGKTWTSLCLYGPHLLVRNSEQAACYELAVEARGN